MCGPLGVLDDKTRSNDNATPAFERAVTSQVVRGHLRPRPPGSRRLGIVLAASWPTWLCCSAVINVQCDVVLLLSRVSHLPWYSDLVSLFPSTRFHPDLTLPAAAALLRTFSSAEVLLVQGPFAWQTVLQATFPLCVWCSHSPPPVGIAFPGWSFTTCEHHLCGGVVDGIWHAACSPLASILPPTVPVTTRRIRHIMHSATPGRFVSAPAPLQDDVCFTGAHPIAPGSEVLDWNGLLSFSNPLRRVRCRSEFVSTKWTHRGLSSSELCHAFDVPLSLIPSFTNIPPARRDSLPFLQAAPTKLLKSLWDSVQFTPGGGAVVSSAGDSVSGIDRATPRLSPRVEKKEDQSEVGNYAKATKSDDAAVPVEIWDDNVWNLNLHTSIRVQTYYDKWKRDPLTTLREAVVTKWKRNVWDSFRSYMRLHHGPGWLTSATAKMDREAGKDCIERMAAADFWGWPQGSRCFFWRWPSLIRGHIRDGFPLWTTGDPPRNLKPQRGEKDPVVRRQMREKIEKVRRLLYIGKGIVYSLTNYFSVPKGDRDIRMVYDATKSRLNHILWAPNFSLPSVETMTRQMEETTWLADLDLGDMFLNFMLDPKLRAFCGVDLRPFFEDEIIKGETLWERWERCLMGLKSSPYVCIKAMLLATEIINGDRLDPTNAYRWDKIILNLPGSTSYDPQHPWLRKIRADSGKIAGCTVTYVDDLRSLGESKQECWRVVHQTGSRLGYLGIQNAPRKTRPPTQNPGAWAGSVALSGPDGVGVKCAMEKWLKGKDLLSKLKAALESGEDLEHKPLEQMRGFFVHIQRTYPNLTPFIKGMHLTLDGWRPGRDAEMWKVRPRPDSEGYWDSKLDAWIPGDLGSLKPPKRVKPAPRLASDVASLERLMQSESPPTRLIRGSKVSVVYYGFVDASGVGFGSAIQTQDGISFRYGLWGRDADATSSNYKELRNLVETVEEGVASGELLGSELFIFTDNSTAEGAYYKGNTDSKLLFELVLRLRVLDMQANIILHVVHVAGTRMIAQGVDALSRGDQTEGVMAGECMLRFIPLHLSATERMTGIKDWIGQWLPEQASRTWLKTEEWFDKGHGFCGGSKNNEGIWIPNETRTQWLIWAPPPTLGDVALEELQVSRHKRTHLNHVFICPRLMTQRWRKMLHKAADLVIEVPAGSRSWWPRSMHEPLIIGLTLRFVHVRPWQLKHSDRFLELGGKLRGLWKEKEGCELDLLRQLCLFPAMLEAMPQHVVC